MCVGSTVMVNTGRWRSSAPAGTIGWTPRIIPTQSTAPPTDTTQTGRASREQRAVAAGHARPWTSARPTTRARPSDTARLLIRTTRARQNKYGAAGKHSRSWRAASSLQMPYRTFSCEPSQKAVHAQSNLFFYFNSSKLQQLFIFLKFSFFF